jgi:hypothetical protein
MRGCPPQLKFSLRCIGSSRYLSASDVDGGAIFRARETMAPRAFFIIGLKLGLHKLFARL